MLTLYGDYYSQPSRAIFALAEIEKDRMGKFNIVEVKLNKLEQYSKEYKAINPIGKVPAFK